MAPNESQCSLATKINIPNTADHYIAPIVFQWSLGMKFW